MEPSDYTSSERTPLRKARWYEQLLLRYLGRLLSGRSGTMHLTLPSGFSCYLGSGAPRAEVTLHNWKPLLRLICGGINGWSDSYLAGEWDSDNLTALVRWALHQEQALSKLALAEFITGRRYNRIHRRNHNSKAGSKRNIAAHYDLGNDFYRLWLDSSMTYSAALFTTGAESLEQAQQEKYQRILQLLDARPDDHILEIGCGWGGFALAAAGQRLRVHGVSLSKEQLNWARESVSKQQLQEQIYLSETDYRDLSHRYDAVVSIEMFEAVGEEHWDEYFQVLKRSLKPGGRAVLQIITINENRFDAYRSQADYIQRYIFPGGMLPTVSILKSKFGQHGFTLRHMQLFGQDYAHTLKIWHRKFNANWDQISALGFDQRFYRMWRYYLAYCEGGFDHQALDVGLYVIEN